MKTIRFCEFTGGGVHHFGEAGYKEACPFLGFGHCTLHDKPLSISIDGWRVCCEECVIPVQVILL